MKLELNNAAPRFKVVSAFGDTVDLESYKGKRVLIAFFRHAGCPFCNLRIQRLMKYHQELKSKNLEMIFFFESPAKLIKMSSFHTGVLPVPIISDPEKIWYNEYGLETSFGKSMRSHLASFLQTAIQAKLKQVPIFPMAAGESISTIPAEFLLDEDLIIRKLHYSSSLTDRMKVDDILAFAEKGTVRL